VGVRVATIVGARPQFVKAAPLGRALRGCGVEEFLIHTGQHYDPELSQNFFSELDIQSPAYELHVGGGGHGAMTGRMLEALEPVLIHEAPDAVVLFGDTNSTLAGALTAVKLGLPVVHIEAGLRSFNRAMPEEINRVVTDHVSQLLLAPTRAAVANLAAEGLTRGVHHVGDVMYDVTLDAADRARAQSTVLERLSLHERGYAVATVHRAENTDDPRRFAEVIEYLQRFAREFPIIFSMHPRTRLAVERDDVNVEGLVTTPPLPYLDMVRLLSSARAVFTDSGGLQKEAYFHRVPCTTLRDETEWVETIDAGWNRLWKGPDYAPRHEIAEYGEGAAAVKCAELIANFSSRDTPA
jgi:UDP-GlcNAc3NAcA epimerase